MKVTIIRSLALGLMLLGPAAFADGPTKPEPSKTTTTATTPAKTAAKTTAKPAAKKVIHKKKTAAKPVAKATSTPAK